MSSFPIRRNEAIERSLSELAALLAAATPTRDLMIRGVAPIADAEQDQLGFLAHRRYLKDLAESRAGALLVSAALVPLLGDDPRPRLVVPDAHVALARLLDALFPEDATAPDIHPTVVLGPGVQIGRKVHIGPYAVLESGVVVADECRVGAHCVLGARARIGAGSVLHPHVVIYPGTVVGERVIVHAGARIGVDGFGYAFHDGRHNKIPQVGTCMIEDEVEIGANTAIDRGSIGETRVGTGAKLDNLVQLGHNVEVGAHAILAGQAGVAGSSRVGAGAMAGGQVGIAGHLEVGEGVRLAAQSGVMGDIPAGQTVMGFPARPRMEFLRSLASRDKVPDLVRRVRRLEEADSNRGGD